jgi:hypothetical protein
VGLFFVGAVMAETKVCTKCGIVKDRGDFCKDRTRKDGFYPWCKQCQSVQNKKNREKYKEKLEAYHKDYYEKNKEQIIEYKKKWREKNKKRLKKKRHDRYVKNKEHEQKLHKAYREKHKAKLKVYHTEYRKQNVEQLRKYDRKRLGSVTLYDTYAHQLTVHESPISDENGYLLVMCTYCGRYFYPTQGQVKHRINALKGNVSEGRTGVENRLYCSPNCKDACPIYRRLLWPAGYKEVTSREVQPELRQMRLACDEYACQRCGKTIDDAQLHCHHIEGIVQNPIESADLDNTITLCKKCHKWAHTQEGCRYFELRCE